MRGAGSRASSGATSRGPRRSPPRPRAARSRPSLPTISPKRAARPTAGRTALPPAPEPMAGQNDQLAGLPDSARRFIRGASRQNYLAMVGARTNAALDRAGAVRRADGPFLGQSFRGLGRQADGDRPRRAARVRGDPAARAGPVPRHAGRGRAAPGDAALSRPGPVDRPGFAGRPARRRASAGSGAASTRISPAKSSSCTRSGSIRATARPTSPNSPAR